MNTITRIATAVSVSAVTLAGLMVSPVSADPIAGDSVIGSGIAGFSTFNVNAVSGPNGEAASGTVSLSGSSGIYLGKVSCLNASGNTATVGGTLTKSPIFGVSGFILHVIDNAGTGSPDQLRLELVQDPPVFCPSSVDMISPAVVTEGDVSVVDSVNPAPTFESVASDIRGFNLEQGVQNSLLAKLSAAAKANSPVNCNQLNALNNQINALSGQKLTEEQAEYLTGKVAELREGLGCL